MAKKETAETLEDRLKAAREKVRAARRKIEANILEALKKEKAEKRAAKNKPIKITKKRRDTVDVKPKTDKRKAKQDARSFAITEASKPKQPETARSDSKQEDRAAENRKKEHLQRLESIKEGGLVLLCEKYKIASEGLKKDDMVKSIFNHESRL